MRSRLFEIHIPGTSFTIPIFSYGFMIMVGFLVGVYLARARARRVSMDPDAITDMGIVALVCGVLGARLLHIVQYSEVYFIPDRPGGLLRMLQIWRGGLVFYGGFIAAAIGIAVFASMRKLRLLQALDVAAPSVILGLAFGRVGCFLNGCCYGVPADPTDVPWAVVFPPDALAYAQDFAIGTPLHPTQVYSSIAAVLIFITLSVYFERRRHDGEVTFLLCALYPIARFFLEMFRADTAVETGLTKSQWTSVFVFVVAVSLFVALRRRSRSLPPAKTEAENPVQPPPPNRATHRDALKPPSPKRKKPA